MTDGGLGLWFGCRTGGMSTRRAGRRGLPRPLSSWLARRRWAQARRGGSGRRWSGRRTRRRPTGPPRRPCRRKAGEPGPHGGVPHRLGYRVGRPVGVDRLFESLAGKEGGRARPDARGQGVRAGDQLPGRREAVRRGSRELLRDLADECPRIVDQVVKLTGMALVGAPVEGPVGVGEGVPPLPAEPVRDVACLSDVAEEGKRGHGPQVQLRAVPRKRFLNLGPGAPAPGTRCASTSR